MPADNYIINNDESKVKQLMFQTRSSTEVKHLQEVKTSKGTETVEIVDAPSIIIPELRTGSHNMLAEEVMRQAAICYNEEVHLNVQRQKIITKLRKEWEKSDPVWKEQMLKDYPDYLERLKDVPLTDGWTQHAYMCLALVSNMSVSSSDAGGKPIIHRYLEPHTKTESIERMKHLPEDEIKKKPLGGIFG